MAISVVMPALEMAQETGKLLAWKKNEGEQVTKGEPLLEIETDKAVVEVEAPGDGILAGVTAVVGAEIPVGQIIAWLVKAGEQPPAPSATGAVGGRSMTAKQAPVPAQAPAQPQASLAAPQISPKARRLAKELGVDINQVRGTGPAGTISSEDIQAAAEAKASISQAPRASTPPAALSRIARIMAEKTTEGWTTVPHFFLTRDVDCSRLLAEQRKLAAGWSPTSGLKLTISDLLVLLTAKILEKHPKLNATWGGDQIRSNPDINISLAIAVQDGVVGAVIHKANTLTLAEISSLRGDLRERARANCLRPADITGGTFTLSNLGMYQVDSFLAIITPPQSAVLAVGALADRVIAVAAKPVVRPLMSMTLSADHRVVDGVRAAEFMGDLARAIEDPSKWFR
jgi:pyruvate dehydrogenase E2 component (dihydrolipoamide acetyltransferase)